MSAPTEAFVGLGANLGDAAATLRAAIARLGALPMTRVQAASRLYRTPAWGIADQPDFVNAVACLQTSLGPRVLLDALLEIERAHGRDRSAGIQWGPRTLDLDLLLYGQQCVDEPGLHLPHPRIGERAFVLVPLYEIAPHSVVPGQGAVADLLHAMETTSIEAIG